MTLDTKVEIVVENRTNYAIVRVVRVGFATVFALLLSVSVQPLFSTRSVTLCCLNTRQYTSTHG